MPLVPRARRDRPPRLVHDESRSPGPALDEVLVVCPRCAGCATVRPRDPARRHPVSPHRLVCGRCALVKDWEPGPRTYGGNYGPSLDPHFSQPLWLQAPCCGQTLWAYNLAHLNYIGAYVAADLRQRRRHPAHGWSNSSLASRLPRWMVLRKHRDEVLRAVAKLKEKASAA
jgi:hypothetical protein